MQFIAGLVFFSLLFIFIFVVGGFLVFRKTWFIPWLKANIGISFLFIGLAGCAGLILLGDMYSLDGEVHFGTAQSQKIGVQSQFVQLNTQRLGERDIQLVQPRWRLRAIHVRWSGILPKLGVSDGILLYDLQQSDEKDMIKSEVFEHHAVVHVWKFGQQFLHWLPGVNFEFLMTQWHPATVEALYDLSATKAGLILKNRQKAPPREGTAEALFEQH